MQKFKTLNSPSIAEGCVTLGKRDVVFENIVVEHGLPPLWQRSQSLRTLIHIVLEQKVSLASAMAVMTRVDALCGDFEPDTFLQVPKEALRAAGVSARKTDYCRELAHAMLTGTLSLSALRHLGDRQVIKRLSALRGIGPWTAGVYLTMALCRSDAWPSGDRALALGAARRWGLKAVPSYAELDQMAEDWRPLRGVATRLIWHAYLQDGHLDSR